MTNLNKQKKLLFSLIIQDENWQESRLMYFVPFNENTCKLQLFFTIMQKAVIERQLVCVCVEYSMTSSSNLLLSTLFVNVASDILQGSLLPLINLTHSSFPAFFFGSP